MRSLPHHVPCTRCTKAFMRLAKGICFIQGPRAAISHGELAGSALGGQVVPQRMKVHAVSRLVSVFWSTEMMGLSVPTHIGCCCRPL